MRGPRSDPPLDQVTTRSLEAINLAASRHDYDTVGEHARALHDGWSNLYWRAVSAQALSSSASARGRLTEAASLRAEAEAAQARRGDDRGALAAGLEGAWGAE